MPTPAYDVVVQPSPLFLACLRVSSSNELLFIYTSSLLLKSNTKHNGLLLHKLEQLHVNLQLG